MKVAYLSGMHVSASALLAQREAMDVAAENLANQSTTRTESGEPYRRQVVSFQAESLATKATDAPAAAQTGRLDLTDRAHLDVSAATPLSATESSTGVTTSVAADLTEFPEVYDPGHPDADANGMVRMPNVDVAQEMVSLMAASRAYEANVAALRASQKLAESGLDLAR